MLCSKISRHTNRKPPGSPKFTVALLHTPRASPYHARFLVPLDFSKYDLRDYLYHAYNVRCFNIRSVVKQQPVRDTRDQPRHWFRPESQKFMTVEMEEPFVWPEQPDLKPWGQATMRQEVEEAVEANGAPSPKAEREAGRRLREQAMALLGSGMGKGKKKGKSQVKDKGDVEEVEEVAEVAEKEKVEPLQAWERRRPVKRTTNDERERFTVKV